MIKYIVYFLAITAFAGSIYACKKESLTDHDKIQDEWLWVKSQGSFAGWTITPESEGYSRSLFIDNTTYIEYQNDSIITQLQYIFKIDSVYGTYGYMDFEPGGHLGVEVIDNTLELIEPSADGYVHFYKRE